MGLNYLRKWLRKFRVYIYVICTSLDPILCIKCFKPFPTMQ